MRDGFVRRVAGLLLAMLLAVLCLSKHGPFRMTLAQALEMRFHREEAVASSPTPRMLTAPILSADEVARLKRGAFSGAYRGEAGGSRPDATIR